jgi:NAD(P)-dependent dehydrogenase (short-subunit alcohol dehydrogenase family)
MSATPTFDMADVRGVVAGGASSSGREQVATLAGLGASLAVADRSGEAARGVAAEDSAAGRAPPGLELDVTDRSAVRRAFVESAVDAGFNKLVKRFGSNRLQDVDEGGFDDWNGQTAVNLTGARHLVPALRPHQREPSDGGIILRSSVAGIPGILKATPVAATADAAAGPEFCGGAASPARPARLHDGAFEAPLEQS